jgi:hypothetical protein
MADHVPAGKKQWPFLYCGAWLCLVVPLLSLFLDLDHKGRKIIGFVYHCLG